MQVHAAAPGKVKDPRAKDHPERDDNHQVRANVNDALAGVGIAKGWRLDHREAQAVGGLFHWR